jgi:hypothetical protein
MLLLSLDNVFKTLFGRRGYATNLKMKKVVTLISFPVNRLQTEFLNSYFVGLDQLVELQLVKFEKHAKNKTPIGSNLTSPNT